jgi:putative DNA primase/helicase
MLIDLNLPPPPPRLALPVMVGLGKTTAAQRAIAELIRSGALGRRKVAVGVPRLDLADEQCQAFRELGLDAIVWRGRGASDPRAGGPEVLMCRDPSAPADAIEVEQVVEQSACKVTRDGVAHICPLYATCGYQAQKEPARRARLILTAHDTLFHIAPRAIGGVGLLVLDEGFWAAGLRGLDGKMVITLDGLRPTLATVQCYGSNNRERIDDTADLAAYRGRLWRVLADAQNGPVSVAALRSTELTPEMCRTAAGLEHRRLRNPGLLPGMDPTERARRIAKVMPRPGEPWAPPRRAAAMWRLFADALEHDHDVAGAEVFNAMTENGTVRALRLRWRADLRIGWGGQGPILHLDATLRPDLVTPFIPDITVEPPLIATEPHVHVHQILGAPTSANALTPAPEAPQRQRDAAATHLREIATLIALRATTLRGRSPTPPDLLVIAQQAVIVALRQHGLPRNVDVAHFNALSGMDGWRDVAGLMVLGRTLPAPATVESIAAAVTNRVPATSRGEVAWWYASAERQINLADGGVHRVSGEGHADATAEAARWSICEGELIQALGRGRGVNRTVDNPLEIDLLTDVVLPVTVDEVLAWDDVRPSRRDAMAATGVVLENAADMAKGFPELWPSHDAARQDRARSVTFGYYRTFYNSDLSHSSSVVTYRPAGAGQKDRQARFDLGLIPDPRAWLEQRLGPLAHFEVIDGAMPDATPRAAGGSGDAAAKGDGVAASALDQRPIAGMIDPAPCAPDDTAQALEVILDIVAARVRLTDLSTRLDAVIHQRIANDRTSLAALSARLEAARPCVVAA